jgi:hypothetical protein
MDCLFSKFSFALQVCLIVTSSVIGQQISVDGGFLKDSVHIGDELPYWLTASYPTHLTVLFPDSTFSFAPFEYSHKQIFTTKSIGDVSFDSVVYYLTTFEIDPVQKLDLPIFVVTRKDCTEFRASADSVRLVSLIKDPPEDTVAAQHLPLKTDTKYERVLRLFNYPILIGIIVGVVILLVVGWLIFGRQIMKYFRIKRLTRQFQDFRKDFRSQLELVRTDFSPELTERTLSTWKKYLERLERKPFTKLTTRETIQMEQDDSLGDTLRLLDMAIYGHNTSVIDSLQSLERVAESRFSEKLQKIKNG